MKILTLQGKKTVKNINWDRNGTNAKENGKNYLVAEMNMFIASTKFQYRNKHKIIYLVSCKNIGNQIDKENEAKTDKVEWNKERRWKNGKMSKLLQ